MKKIIINSEKTFSKGGKENIIVETRAYNP